MNPKYADNKLAVNLMKKGVDIDGPQFLFLVNGHVILQTDDFDEIDKMDVPENENGLTIIDLDCIRKEFPYGFGFF
jgi:hypothetical protein